MISSIGGGVPATRRRIGAKWSSTICSSGGPVGAELGAGHLDLAEHRRHLALGLHRPSGRHCRPWCRSSSRPSRLGLDQRGLARHGAQERGQRRVDAGEQARDLQALVEAVELDQAHVGDVLVPDLDVLLEVEAAHPVRRAPGWPCRSAATWSRPSAAGRAPRFPRRRAGGSPCRPRSRTPCGSRRLVNRPGMPLVSGSPLARSNTLSDAGPAAPATLNGGMSAPSCAALQAAEDAVLERVARPACRARWRPGSCPSAAPAAARPGRAARRGARRAPARCSGARLRSRLRVPVDADPGLERIGVELVRRVEHQVVLQRLVGLLEVVLVGGAQPLLEAARRPAACSASSSRRW